MSPLVWAARRAKKHYSHLYVKNVILDMKLLQKVSFSSGIVKTTLIDCSRVKKKVFTALHTLL